MKKNEEYTARDILGDAQAIINKLTSGKEFKLKDLFRPIDWDEFPKNERLAAGTIFRSKSTDEDSLVINTGKTSSNSLIYKKK